jgi:hypothetical protein
MRDRSVTGCLNVVCAGTSAPYMSGRPVRGLLSGKPLCWHSNYKTVTAWGQEQFKTKQAVQGTRVDSHCVPRL